MDGGSHFETLHWQKEKGVIFIFVLVFPSCRNILQPTSSINSEQHWRIAEQHYFTDGQIYLVGDGHRRRKGKKADYILRYTDSFPIATVEAKAEDLESGAGLQQSKDYAQTLGLSFAYSTNGHGIEEWDFTTNTQRSLTEFRRCRSALHSRPVRS